MSRLSVAFLLIAVVMPFSGGCHRAERRITIRVSGSAVGDEGAILRRQTSRFMSEHPDIEVLIQPTPDDATQRHQLYVQWLNANVGRPDVLQLDVIWTPEFAAAGWILPLDEFSPRLGDFFPATIEANRWQDRLYAIPWFVDVGMLYWRTDLIDHPPRTMEELLTLARAGQRRGATYGIVWQGARYEGLITVFLEYLGGFGGSLLTPDLDVTVDSEEAIRALTFMKDQILRTHVAPPEVLTWHEEETRYAFQNGRAVMMRNWPYAAALLRDPKQSAVAGHFGVAVMPAAADGEPTASLGGAELAINAASEHPRQAFALIEYLAAPEQMMERARLVGQYPARRSVFDRSELSSVLPVAPAKVLEIIEAARPRPVTPIYSELSEALQIELHRALADQKSSEQALGDAADEMRAIIARTGIRSAMKGEH